jgi:hypothetical protein
MWNKPYSTRAVSGIINALAACICILVTCILGSCPLDNCTISFRFHYFPACFILNPIVLDPVISLARLQFHVPKLCTVLPTSSFLCTHNDE